MTREFRLMLADPELVERDVHRPAGVSAAEAMREAAAQECEQLARDFLDPAYAGSNPINSLSERFACGRCAEAIRSLPIPADPRDAEIAALRAALEDLVDAAGYLLSGVGCLRGKTPEEEDWWMHERSAELELAASEGRARAALAQSGETKA